MKIARLIVRGEDVTPLVDLLRQRVKNAYLYLSDNTTVLASEKYFLRNNCTLLSLVVFDLRLPHTCNVEVVSGGGSYGFLDLDLGAHRRRNRELIGFIKSICVEKSWTLEDVQAP